MRARTVFLAACLVAAALAGCKKKPKEEIDKGGELTPPVSERMTPTPAPRPIDESQIGTGELGDTPLDDVYFDFDRYDIRPDQRPTLNANADWLLANRGQNVLIEGHCDERGTEEYNLALGDKRANAARDYLRTAGIPAGRMSTISYGKAYPVDPGHNESAWAKNRRAHFTLVAPKVGQLR